MLFIHIYYRPWYYIFLTVISSSHWDTMIIDHPTDQRWGRHKASPLGSPSGEIKKNFVFIKQTIIVYLWIEPYVLKYLQNIGFFFKKKKLLNNFCFFESIGQYNGTLFHPFTQHPHRLTGWSVTSHHLTEGVNYVANCPVVGWLAYSCFMACLLEPLYFIFLKELKDNTWASWSHGPWPMAHCLERTTIFI